MFSNPQICLNLQRPLVGINLDSFGCSVFENCIAKYYATNVD